MTTPPETFVAESNGPPRRRLWIVRDHVATPGTTRGWSFVVDQMSPSGEWEPHRDTWEEFFFEILRYPPLYADSSIVWRNEATGEPVSLEDLQPLLDGKLVGPDETPESAGLRRS